MARVAANVQFPLTLREADVREWCGPSAYFQGDLWQKLGRVGQRRVTEGAISAQVLGSVRRVDSVSATLTGKTGAAAPGRPPVQTTCTCAVGPFCRHVAALLLQWVRAPESFAAPATRDDTLAGMMADAAWDPDWDDMLDEEDEQPVVEGPQEELARLLSGHVMTALREIARKRNVRVKAASKVELIERLAPLLAEPENIDAALAELTREARTVLDIIDLGGSSFIQGQQDLSRLPSALIPADLTRQDVHEGFEQLIRLGLVMHSSRYTGDLQPYTIPLTVRLRLPPRPLVRTATERRDWQHMPASGGESDMDPVELMLAVAEAVRAKRVAQKLPTIYEWQVQHLPVGWQRHPDELPTAAAASGRTWTPETRVIPLPSLLSERDLDRLERETGESRAKIEFAVNALVGLGALDDQGSYDMPLVIRGDQLTQFIALPPGQRRQVLTALWLNSGDVTDFATILSQDSRLQLFLRTATPYSYPAVEPASADVRRDVAHLLMRSLPNEGRDWYSVEGLLDFFWRMEPQRLAGKYYMYQQPAWRFMARGKVERKLNLKQREDWLEVWRPLLGAMLIGPLRWLGLIEVAMEAGEPVAYRVLPQAGILRGEEADTEVGETRPAIIEAAPEGIAVQVPLSTAAPGIYSVLAQIGQLDDMSPRGLRYLIRADRLQTLFTAGVTGPELVERLGGYTERGRLDPSVAATIDAWWRSYGAVRLYDEVTLIELADDYLLTELEATTSLGRALVHAFTPRLLAVDPAMVDDVLADLARVGHTPRIVEEVESTSVDPSRQPAGSVENTDVLARIPGGRP